MDSILNWNDVALEANRVSHTDGSKEQNGPTLSSRALAIVHLAMYDAFAGIINNAATFPPYNAPLPAGAPADSPDNRQWAVAGAAFTTLIGLFPSQSRYFKKQLQLLGNEASAAHTFGVKVGSALLALRKNDPSASRGTYEPPRGRGKHQVDPDNPGQGFHGPLYGEKMKPFAVSQRHTLDDMPFNRSLQV